MKRLISVFLCVCCLQVVSQHYGRYEIIDPFPFSAAELVILKEKKVSVVSAITTDQDGEKTGVDYRFDKNGLLQTTQYYTIKRKKHIEVSTVYYRYYPDGKLKAVSWMPCIEYYDSLSYDRNGILSYYIHQAKYPDNETKKSTTHTRNELKRNAGFPDKLVYTYFEEGVLDSINTPYIELVTLDSTYSRISSRSAGYYDGVDTVEKKVLNEREYKLWFIYLNDSTHQSTINREEYYKDGKLIREENFARTAEAERYFNYEYDSKGMLIMVHNAIVRYVFVRGEDGLKTDEIVLYNFYGQKTTKFSYRY